MNGRPTRNDFVLSYKHHRLNGALDFDFNPSSSEVYKMLVSVLKDANGVSIPLACEQGEGKERGRGKGSLWEWPRFSISKCQ